LLIDRVSWGKGIGEFCSGIGLELAGVSFAIATKEKNAEPNKK
jgi:hypothetical protein